MRTALALVGLAALVIGCTSPEATRMRAGGAGADVGNRTPIVHIHEGAQPFWDTPERLGKDVGMRDLESARQAHILTRDPAASPATGRR